MSSVVTLIGGTNGLMKAWEVTFSGSDPNNRMATTITNAIPANWDVLDDPIIMHAYKGAAIPALVATWALDGRNIVVTGSAGCTLQILAWIPHTIIR